MGASAVRRGQRGGHEKSAAKGKEIGERIPT